MRLRAAILIAIATTALFGCPGRNGAGPADPTDADSRALVEVFFMSQCPYSAKLMQFLPDVIADLEGGAELVAHAVVDRRDDGEYSAMHGAQELFGNVLTLCAAAHAPDDVARAAFLKCISTNIAAVPFGWEDCASLASVPVEPVTSWSTRPRNVRPDAPCSYISSLRSSKGSVNQLAWPSRRFDIG